MLAVLGRKLLRAVLGCAASDKKLGRLCGFDQMLPGSPDMPFSFIGSFPKDVEEGQGRSSSDEAKASESGVAFRAGCPPSA